MPWKQKVDTILNIIHIYIYIYILNQTQLNRIRFKYMNTSVLEE